MKTNLRKAVAMIELIFSIVVMGIVMMSAPMLISTASKSGYVGMQQEAINEAATQLNIILGYHWDENNTDERYIDTVLNVNAGDIELNKDSATQRRTGTPIESWRTFVREDGTNNLTASPSTSFGENKDNSATETDKDDMDDFHGTSTTLTVVDSSTDTDYTDTVNISTNVSYIEDNASYQNQTLTFAPDYSTVPADTTNIKHLQVTLTSTSGVDELKKTIILHAFSCNIGAYKLESEDW